MKIKSILVIVVASTTFITSCNRKGCLDEAAINYDKKAKKSDGNCFYQPTSDLNYTIPTTYTFEDKNGNSTVSYGGQMQRLNMLEEMVAYLKTANTKGTTISATVLKEMYDNTYTGWTDTENLGLAGSSKQLKNKSAGGDAKITTMFESYMDSAAALSALNMDGSAGQGGVYPSDGSKGPYLMSAKGIEYTQWIEKGLMGAVSYYNISQVYFGSEKMDVDNTTPVSGEFYTEMEHHWDEAYGYFTEATDYPTNGTERFWGKYTESREDVLGSSTAIAEAFRKGRAAISNDDLTTRDEQITIIRTELEKVVAGTAIHYLNSAISNISLNTSRNHSLSEATAFINDLAYGYNSTLSQSDIDGIISTIGDDFNNVSAANLTSARDELASIMGMTDIKNQL